MRIDYWIRGIAACLAAACLAHAGCANRVDEISAKDDRVREELPAPAPALGDWPWWRGPGRNGAAPDQTAPTVWSKTEQIAWRSETPGRGHASPVIWGRRVFVATADEQRQVQSLLCFDRSDGRLLWSRPIHQGGFMHAHPKNSQASATPACDGRRVFTAMINSGGLWVTAVDFDGRILWRTEAGPFHSEHGFGASPALYGDLILVASDSPGASYVAALRRDTGEIVWRKPRSGGISRPGGGSYGTPLAVNLAGRPQLLLSGRSRVVSYDPNTGREIWSCEGPAETTANTVAFWKDLVFAGAGYPEKGLLCVRADGRGDVTKTRVVWRLDTLKAYVPTPLALNNRVVVAGDDGVAFCLKADTGKILWKQRLRGGFSASPGLAGGNVYATNEDGVTFVFRLADKFELIARNDLGDGGFASPVFSNGQLFLKTNHYLYCIGEPAP